MVTFGSVCSGIEAASVAWHPSGWRAAWLSEIEAFPSALLAEKFPEVPNLGDMMQIREYILKGWIPAPEIFVGGTPCQAFSVAGLRGGLSDARGALTLEYIRILDAIDDTRESRGEPAAVAVWENVPGVLSSKDNAFGHFLAGLAGDSEAIENVGKWSNAGLVIGPRRVVAWRVLDAQFFGVAQRRRRVFVVASAREGFDPGSVLFESEGVRRHTPPSRDSGESVTGTLTARTCRSIGAQDAQQGHLISEAFRMVAFGEYSDDGTASTMKARDYKDATDLAVDVVGALDTQCGFEKSNHQSILAGHILPVAYGIPGNWIGRAPENGGNATEPMHNVAPCQTTTDRHGVALGMQVRRLTPVECERLQGFPDNYTLIHVRGRPCSDGPRYKALGNSMAVPVMAWIGSRINEALQKDPRSA